MERYCCNCGTKLKNDALFCQNCGAKVTSRSLVQRAINKEEAALEEIYIKTRDKAYAVAIQFTKNEDDAMDILQEAYITVFKKIDTLQDESKLTSWINMIVANRCRDWKRKKNPMFFSELESDDQNIDFEDTLENDKQEFMPEESVDYEETKNIMDGILGTLPDEQRLSILMYYYEELSVGEIAEAMECSTGTVKSRLNYARKKIKDEVEILEKKGTKLYGIAPLPFIVWMLHEQEVSAANSSTYGKVWNAVKAGSANKMKESVADSVIKKAGADTQTKVIAKNSARAGSKAIITKAVAGITAIAVVGTSGYMAYQHFGKNRDIKHAAEKPVNETVEETVIANYEWVTDANIEADEIYYVTNTSQEVPYNNLAQQFMSPYAVIKKNGQLGLIDMDGNMKVDVDNSNIIHLLGNYGLLSSNSKYSNLLNREHNAFRLDENDELATLDGLGGGGPYWGAYYDYSGITNINALMEADKDQWKYNAVMPMKKSDYSINDIDSWKNLSGKYAICNSSGIVTEYEYDECGGYSSGLLAVCKDGKWGYANENGEIVIPIEYGTSWAHYISNPSEAIDYKSEGTTKNYCYSASYGYVNLQKDGEWELRDTEGNLIIQAGIFEEICPVYRDKCWVKKDGKWGVVRITKDSEIKNHWKEMLVRQVKETLPYNYTRFMVFDFDGNGIPEVMGFSGDHATLYTYSNGEIESISCYSGNNIYIEDEGIFAFSVDVDDNTVYQVDEFGIEKIGKGHYYAENVSGEPGIPEYEYQWKGSKVSPEEFESKLSEIKNSEKAKNVSECPAYDMETTIEVLYNYGQSNKDIAWKTKYKDKLNQLNESDYYGYELTDIDGDGIPELFAASNYTAGGTLMYYYKNGKLQEEKLSQQGYGYIKGTGLIFTGRLSHGIQASRYCRLADEGVITLASGRIEETGYDEESNEMICEYYWNDIPVSKEQYEKEEYDLFKSKGETENNLVESKNDIIGQINAY